MQESSQGAWNILADLLSVFFRGSRALKKKKKITPSEQFPSHWEWRKEKQDSEKVSRDVRVEKPEVDQLHSHPAHPSPVGKVRLMDVDSGLQGHTVLPWM